MFNNSIVAIMLKTDLIVEFLTRKLKNSNAENSYIAIDFVMGATLDLCNEEDDLTDNQLNSLLLALNSKILEYLNENTKTVLLKRLDMMKEVIEQIKN